MKVGRCLQTLLGLSLSLLLVDGAYSAPKKSVRIDGFPDYDTHFKSVLPDFMKSNADLEVTFLINNHEDHHKKLTNNLATGSGAGDVTLVDVSRLGAFVNAGGFVNLSAAPYNADKIADQFAPYSWAQGKGTDGNQYAIPIDLGPGVLFYRRDLVEGMGYKIEDVTKDWDSYINFGIELKKKKGIALIANAADIAELIVNATIPEGEGIYFDKDGKSLLKSERFVKAFTLAKRVRDAGLDLGITSWTNEWYEALREGKVATQLSGAWLLGHLKNWIAPKSVGLWGASNLPNGIYGSWGGSFVAIPKQSKNPAEAWRVIQYLVQPDTQLRGLTGIAAFPANVKTYNDKAFQEPVEYLKGQKARLLFADIAKKIRATKPAKGDLIAVTIYQNALEEVIRQGKDVNQTIAQADQLLARRTKSLR
ncbi:MAG TPA: extracellular solute-binding protein [Oligoflexus sp.]|uniref:extracellular solute-binding protein n=1 Tax=Oligoflexus sp. TaxID=1971216 RepID=UPI002D8036E2|nr:extracellular solute-binding protein [Oligoflexus sp.]HET9237709.1 extracellular solute-binding protein [Oligoflexus sp.]